jgi:hypothetical protein
LAVIVLSYLSMILACHCALLFISDIACHCALLFISDIGCHSALLFISDIVS